VSLQRPALIHPHIIITCGPIPLNLLNPHAFFSVGNCARRCAKSHGLWPRPYKMVLDMGDGTVLYGNQLAILLSFLDEIPQLHKLSKELLLLGFRQLIKAACLQGNSAAVSISINLLAPNNDQATPSVVPANSGHSSPGQGNVSGEVEDLPGQQLRRRKRRRGSCSHGARPYAPAAEAWRRRRRRRRR
jgi:hypothetical protein